MFTTTTWAVIGTVLTSYHLCRFMFWLDSPAQH